MSATREYARNRCKTGRRKAVCIAQQHAPRSRGGLRPHRATLWCGAGSVTAHAGRDVYARPRASAMHSPGALLLRSMVPPLDFGSPPSPLRCAWRAALVFPCTLFRKFGHKALLP